MKNTILFEKGIPKATPDHRERTVFFVTFPPLDPKGAPGAPKGAPGAPKGAPGAPKRAFGSQQFRKQIEKSRKQCLTTTTNNCNAACFWARNPVPKPSAVAVVGRRHWITHHTSNANHYKQAINQYKSTNNKNTYKSI